MHLGKILRGWRQFLPRQCVICKMSSTHTNICASCEQALPRLAGVCQLCALPFHSTCSPICGPCLLNPPPWQRLVSLCEYTAPVDSLIHALKYHADFASVTPLTHGLATRVMANRQCWPDVMVPVPMHRWRHWRRGFNQALEITRQLHQILHVPVRTDLCRRIRNTATQTGLEHAGRKANVKNAFVAHPQCAGQHVAVVDDVLTTGATLRALCGELDAAGAASLEIWTCARVVRPGAPAGFR